VFFSFAPFSTLQEEMEALERQQLNIYPYHIVTSGSLAT
jgi:hypothetical protein